jgi:hypothetical protein
LIFSTKICKMHLTKLVSYLLLKLNYCLRFSGTFPLISLPGKKRWCPFMMVVATLNRNFFKLSKLLLWNFSFKVKDPLLNMQIRVTNTWEIFSCELAGSNFTILIFSTKICKMHLTKLVTYLLLKLNYCLRFSGTFPLIRILRCQSL